MATPTTPCHALDHIKCTRDIGSSTLKRLADLVTPEQIAAKIQGMLGATMVVRTGAESTEERPDWRTIEAAVKLWLSYQLGMPVQRQVVVQQAPETGEATMSRLMSSPAAVKVLETMLAKAKDVGGGPTAEAESE